jgi:hypothetical protein
VKVSSGSRSRTGNNGRTLASACYRSVIAGVVLRLAVGTALRQVGRGSVERRRRRADPACGALARPRADRSSYGTRSIPFRRRRSSRARVRSMPVFRPPTWGGSHARVAPAAATRRLRSRLQFSRIWSRDACPRRSPPRRSKHSSPAVCLTSSSPRSGRTCNATYFPERHRRRQRAGGHSFSPVVRRGEGAHALG